MAYHQKNDFHHEDGLVFDTEGREPRDRIPTYLYRVFSSKSKGVMNTSWAKSADAAHDAEGATIDVFARPDRARAADMINRHFHGQPGDDNLVSWTSSLLCALVSMFHAHASLDDGSPFEEIYLCIVNTKDFRDGVFMKDLHLVAGFCDASPGLRELEALEARRDGDCYHFGEYLTQGALRIERSCNIVSAKSIIDRGLSRVRREFADLATWGPQEEPPSASTLLELRRVFDGPPTQDRNDKNEEVMQGALAIARLFEAPFRIAMAVALMALADPRGAKPFFLFAPDRFSGGIILTKWHCVSLLTSLDNERRSCSLSEAWHAADRLPEVNEFLALMQYVAREQCLLEFRSTFFFSNISAPVISQHGRCLANLGVLLQGHVALADQCLRNARKLTHSRDFCGYSSAREEDGIYAGRHTTPSLLHLMADVKKLTGEVEVALVTAGGGSVHVWDGGSVNAWA